MPLAVLLALVAEAESDPWLAEAFLVCHDIEIAPVEAIERIDRIPDTLLAKLRIERSIWVADCEDVRTVLLHEGWDGSPQPLSIGGRSVWFLVDSISRPEEWDTRARIELWSHHRFERVGCRIPIETWGAAPYVLLPKDDWKPFDAWKDPGGADRMELSKLEELLWAEIRRRTPCVEGHSAGTSNGNFVIEPGGEVTWPTHPNRRIPLHEDEMHSILAAIERGGFFEIPHIPGPSPKASDSGGGRSLAVSGLVGRHWVYVREPPDPKVTKAVNVIWRFDRIWKSIPQRITRFNG